VGGTPTKNALDAGNRAALRDFERSENGRREFQDEGHKASLRNLQILRKLEQILFRRCGKNWDDLEQILRCASFLFT